MRTLVLFLSALLLLTNCGEDGPEPDATSAEYRYRLGLAISMDTTTSFFASLLDGAEESAERLNAEIITFSAGEDASLQSEQIIGLVGLGVDALLLNPVSDAVIPAVEEVSAMNVPVFTIDRSVRSEAVVCHIASDNRAGGKMAGDYLAESLHRSGRLVEIRGTSESSAAHERGQGFRDAMEAYPDIQIAVSFDADFSRSLARERFAEILEEHSAIDGVFAHNDEMILGAARAAGQAGRTGILFVGFDAIDEAVTAVEDGRLLATVAQKPAEMGRLGVETAIQFVSGRPVPDSITVDLALIIR